MRPIVGSVLLVLILLSTPIMLSDSGAAVKRDSVPSPGFHSMSSCCQGKRGNVNGLGTIDLGDLSALVSYLTGGGFVVSCPEAADVNGVGNIDLGDLSALVSYLTGSGYVPLNCLTVTDIDGNLYQTVTIGGRIWLAGNLKVTHYRNGDPISNVTDNGVWGNLTTGAYCAYGNDSTNIAPYGLLYNWYGVSDGRGLAPAGWHVATDTEWQQLELTLGMSQADVDAIASARGTTEGGKIKEAGTSHWTTPNTGANNETGFAALPGGYREESGDYFGLGDAGNFWSSTKRFDIYAWYRNLSSQKSTIGRFDRGINMSGFSVRCVNDLAPEVTTVAVNAVMQTAARCGGTVTSDGGAMVTARGVCWSSNPLPTVADSKTTDGTGTGSFVSAITGLTATPFTMSGRMPSTVPVPATVRFRC
jgi:uncharacterized protein (TIGR02145 family)